MRNHKLTLLLLMLLLVPVASADFLTLANGEQTYWQSGTITWNGSPMGVYTNPYSGTSYTSQVQPGGIYAERESDIGYQYRPWVPPQVTPPVITPPVPGPIPPVIIPDGPGRPPVGLPGGGGVTPVPEPSTGTYLSFAFSGAVLIRWGYRKIKGKSDAVLEPRSTHNEWR